MTKLTLNLSGLISFVVSFIANFVSCAVVFDVAGGLELNGSEVITRTEV